MGRSTHISVRIDLDSSFSHLKNTALILCPHPSGCGVGVLPFLVRGEGVALFWVSCLDVCLGAALSLLLAVAGTINITMKTSHVKDGCTHYCGRKSSFKNQGIDMSILGNKFDMKNQSDTERTRVIREHKVWLNEQRLADTDVWKALLSLPADAVLGCFCAPKACHCDTIIKAWKWAQSKSL